MSKTQDIHPTIAEQLQHFSFSHLPEHLQDISAPFAVLASHMDRTLRNGPGLIRALGHLRRAKDEAVTTVTGAREDKVVAAARAVMQSAKAWSDGKDSKG